MFMTKTRNKINGIIGAAIAKASVAAVGQSNRQHNEERPTKYLDVPTQKRTSDKYLIRNLKQIKQRKRQEKLDKGMKGSAKHARLCNHQVRKWELLYRQIGLEYAP